MTKTARKTHCRLPNTTLLLEVFLLATFSALLSLIGVCFSLFSSSVSFASSNFFFFLFFFLFLQDSYPYIDGPASYADFLQEYINPIQAKLSALGTKNIDILLLCYGLPYTYVLFPYLIPVPILK
jgi:hypothetical protein